MNIKSKFFRPFEVNAEPTDILFWGCTHYNHDPSWEEPIWRQRGYESAVHAKDSLIKNWNQRSSEKTIGFLLGDIMFGKGGAEEFLSIMKSHNFKEMYVCSGNHFAGFNFFIENYTDCDGNYYLDWNKKIIFCPNLFEAKINRQSVVLSHYPILSFNGQGKGAWHLFSHVHGNLDKSDIGRRYLYSNARVYEVSVEKNPCPINFAELKTIMDSKGDIISFDHHDQNTMNPF
jgi:calcineurin-like phosphoesterase family protein